jgi:hypothetical protein
MARVLQVSKRLRPVMIPTWQVQRIQDAMEQHNAQQSAKFEACFRLRKDEVLDKAGELAATMALSMSDRYRRRAQEAQQNRLLTHALAFALGMGATLHLIELLAAIVEAGR